MQTIKLKTHIGSDGLLKLEVPVGAADVDADVVIIYTLHSKTANVDDAEWQSFVDNVLGMGDDDPTEPSKPPFDLRDYTP